MSIEKILPIEKFGFRIIYQFNFADEAKSTASASSTTPPDRELSHEQALKIIEEGGTLSASEAEKSGVAGTTLNQPKTVPNDIVGRADTEDVSSGSKKQVDGPTGKA